MAVHHFHPPSVSTAIKELASTWAVPPESRNSSEFIARHTSYETPRVSSFISSLCLVPWALTATGRVKTGQEKGTTSSIRKSTPRDSGTEPLPAFFDASSEPHIWRAATKGEKTLTFKNNRGAQGGALKEQEGAGGVCPSCPLPSLMPFSAATLRLCSCRMLSWDAVRLGCLRMHCMVQRRAGGQCHPRSDPCSSRSSAGTRGCEQRAAGQRRAGQGRAGQSPAGGGTRVSPPAPHAGCEIKTRSLPAAAQVEGTCFPPVGFYAWFPEAGEVAD